MTPELCRFVEAWERRLEALADGLEFGALVHEQETDMDDVVEVADVLSTETVAQTLRFVQLALRQAREELGG